MIGAIAISIGAVFISGHIGLPYLPLISPNPVISGYIGFYAGLIALTIIPLIVLIRLAIKFVWGYRSSYKFKTALAGVWVVSFIIFLLTSAFTVRNFVFETSVSETITEMPLTENQPLEVNVNKSRHHDNIRLSLGSAYLTEGHLFSREGIDVVFRPGTSENLRIVRTTSSRGLNERSARRNASYASHEITLEQNRLSLDDFYKINKRDKFRGQHIKYEVEVPIGTQISLNRSSDIFRHREFRRSSARDQIWEMTKDGFEKIENKDQIEIPD